MARSITWDDRGYNWDMDNPAPVYDTHTVADPLPTEDSGTHTNPERYIQTYKFRSPPVDRAGGVATALYTVGTTPARTAGLSTTVWWVWLYNHSGNAATAWLEAPAGTIVSATVQLANNQTTILEVKPLDIGNNDLYINASANNVMAQVGGIEA